MTARVQRRLAAVLAVDMVDYSSHIGDDEFGTITRFKEVVNTIFVPNLKEFNGRIVKTMGDGLLIEFQSAVDAVECAIEVQSEIARRNLKLPAHERSEFRMGINLGDIVIDGDDILGDGVNVASRLETLAPPGGLVISDIVYRNVHGKIEVRFTDIGTQNLKNIARAIQAFVAVLDETTPTKANQAAAAARADSLAARLDEAMAGNGSGIAGDAPHDDFEGDDDVDQRAAPPLPRTNPRQQGGRQQGSRFGSGLATGSAIGLSGIAAVSLLAWWFWPAMTDGGERPSGVVVAERGAAPGRDTTTRPGTSTGAGTGASAPSGTPSTTTREAAATPAPSGATPAPSNNTAAASPQASAPTSVGNDLGAVPGLPPDLAGSTAQSTTGGAGGGNTPRATSPTSQTVAAAPPASVPVAPAPAPDDSRPSHGVVTGGVGAVSGTPGADGGAGQSTGDGGGQTSTSVAQPGTGSAADGSSDGGGSGTGDGAGTGESVNANESSGAADSNGEQAGTASEQTATTASPATCRRQHAGNVVRLGGGPNDDGRTANSTTCAEGPVYIAGASGSWQPVEMDGKPLVARDVHSAASARGPLLVALDNQNHLVLVYSRSPGRIVTAGGSRNAIVAQDRDGRPMKVTAIRRLVAGGNISWGGTLQLEVRTTDGRNCSIAAGPDGLFTWRSWKC